MKPTKLFTLLLLTGLSTCAFAQALTTGSPLSLHGTHRVSNIIHKNISSLSERLIAVTNYDNDGSSYVPHDTTYFQYSNGRYLTASGTYAFDYAALQYYNTATMTYVNNIEVFEQFDSRNNILSDSELSWNGSAYVNASQAALTYDGSNNLLTELSQMWNTGSSAWMSNTYEIYTYDANNNQTGDALKKFAVATGALRNYTNYLSTYDSANKMTQQIYQNWDTVSNAWLNNSKTDYTYDANNNLLQQTEQTWNAGSSSWVNYTNQLNTYTTNLLATTVYQIWNTGTSAWTNTLKNTYTYDANNNLITNIGQGWSGGAWANSGKAIYTYSANNDQLTYIEQGWMASAWVNTNQTVNTYDANHNQLSQITQTWSTGTATWTNATRSRSTYDSYNNITNTITDTWNAGGFWQATTSDVMTNNYYENYYPSGLATVASADGSLNIYPSPVSDLMNIDIHWDTEQPAVIAIYDASGRICRQWQAPSGASYEGNLSVAAMQPGTYYLTVKGQNSQITKGFTVAR